MNEYTEILKRHVAENPPNYGSDAHSILEMLFSCYHATALFRVAVR